MNKSELFLRTAFCCMACDGDIANEEVEVIRKSAIESNLFGNLNIQDLINDYVSKINTIGRQFLSDYIADLSSAELSNEDQLELIKLAIQTIEADEKIEYSEVSFFKRIRKNLSIKDSQILEALPDKEDYLLPDVDVEDQWEWNISFNDIVISVD